jgi:hypothetical protein
MPDNRLEKRRIPFVKCQLANFTDLSHSLAPPQTHSSRERRIHEDTKSPLSLGRNPLEPAKFRERKKVRPHASARSSPNPGHRASQPSPPPARTKSPHSVEEPNSNREIPARPSGTHWRPEDDRLDHVVGAGRAEVVVLPRRRREGLVPLQHRPRLPVPAAGRCRHGDRKGGSGVGGRRRRGEAKRGKSGGWGKGGKLEFSVGRLQVMDGWCCGGSAGRCTTGTKPM